MSDDKSKGKFDHYSHDQLYAMVANSKPERLIDVGDALEEAFHALDGISRDLKVYVTRVKLEGEGGQAFHKWGEKMVMQTTKLAYYVLAAGAGMKLAGEGLATTKSAMPKPDMMCYADPEKDKARLKNRDEAAGLMGALDNYYGVVGVELGKLEEPTFGLPPELKDSVGMREQGIASPSSGGSGVQGGGGGLRREAFPNAMGTGGSASVLPHRAPEDAGGLLPGINVPTGSGAQLTPMPGAHNSGTNIDSIRTVPSPDVVTRPDIPLPPSDISRHPTGPALPPPSLGPNTGLPRAPYRGAGDTGPVPRFDMGKRPEGGSAKPWPGSVPPARVRDGIVGGIPARPIAGSVAPNLPRGTVVGEERGSANRGPMGAGGFAGMPGGGASGVRNPSAGRRLATEPGGTAGAPRAQRGGTSEFTPGGTGLVRGGQGMGPLPHTGVPSANDARLRSGKRPDYLLEDEETWTAGRRDTVPPVIE
ncbi:hypothetical protein M1P56_26140 [Streptomyces sp. HU2014]|uniref:hypothetical protein n=1 Tax=Streptomyces sp. HU2014 TaxID=2939414 RepID=UPI0020104D7A|nr:hypothetical protein [Streptomyces sp. HU2014]UQI47574.1 hypothetical protein M1P56_26140 [Streptomyces sp. HU2014]